MHHLMRLLLAAILAQPGGWTRRAPLRHDSLWLHRKVPRQKGVGLWRQRPWRSGWDVGMLLWIGWRSCILRFIWALCAHFASNPRRLCLWL